MHQSIKALNYDFYVIQFIFANKTILSCFFFFFVVIDLYLLIPAGIAQIFNPIAGLAYLGGLHQGCTVSRP